MGCYAFVRKKFMKSSLALPLRKKTSNLRIQIHVLETWSLTKVLEQKLQCPKEDGENNAWYNMER